MAYQIQITADAERQLCSLTAHQQRLVEDAIIAKLTNQPTIPTRAIKQLRPNPLAQYELRVAELRVLYNVEESTVVLLLVGRKSGNSLIVEGEEFHGHQENPPQQPGGESARDPE